MKREQDRVFLYVCCCVHSSSKPPLQETLCCTLRDDGMISVLCAMESHTTDVRWATLMTDSTQWMNYTWLKPQLTARLADIKAKWQLWHITVLMYLKLILKQVWAKYITCWNSLRRIMCHVEELISKLPELFPLIFFCHIWHSWLAAQTVFLWDLVLSTLPRAKNGCSFLLLLFYCA